MTKTGWKKWIYSIFLTGIFCLLFAMPVFAAESVHHPEDSAINGNISETDTPLRYAKLSVQGYLRTISNTATTLPTYDYPVGQNNFKFLVEPHTYQSPDGKTVKAGAGEFPIIVSEDQTAAKGSVTINADDKSAIVTTGDLPPGEGDDYNCADTTSPPSPSSYVKEKSSMGDLYIDFTGCKIGVYTYKVTEQPDAVLGVFYDIVRTYYINVYVVDQVDTADDNARTETVYVSSVTAFQGENSDTAFGTQPDNPSPSPTPSVHKNDDEMGKAVLGNANSLTVPFVNLYPVNQLVISKTVTGNYASLDKYFKYQLILTPIDDSADPVVTAINYTNGTDPDQDITYVKSDGTPETVHNPSSTSNTGNTTDIYLKSGETIIVNSIPTGVNFEIREITDDVTYKLDYITTRTIKNDGSTAATNTNKGAENGAGTKNPTDSEKNQTEPLYVQDEPWIYVDPTENADNHVTGRISGTPTDIVQIEVDYVNHKEYVPPTEFLLNYWPYVAAVVAVLLIALAVIIRYAIRKKKPKEHDGL